MDKNIYAAIAMALYEFEGTIALHPTLWNAKFLSLTKKPK